MAKRKKHSHQRHGKHGNNETTQCSVEVDNSHEFRYKYFDLDSIGDREPLKF